MVRRMWLIGLVLAMPVIGFAVAEGTKAHLDSELRATALKEVPDADPVKVAELTIANLCQAPSSGIDELCGTNANLSLLSTGALSAGAAGLALLALIFLAGIAAQNSRILLLALFKPGLYLTAIALGGLIFVHAAIAISAVYYGESVFLGRIHIGFIAAIAIGALGGALAIATSTFSLVKKAETIAIGKSVTRQEAPDLWRMVEATADRLGALRPEHIIVGLDPNFFVTEVDVVSLSGRLTGRTLYCSLSLSRLLTKAELASVIGHELGHFKGADTKFSERFYPIYRGTTTALSSLLAAGGEGSGSLALLPAIAILSYFLESFSVAESKLGRERELAADQAGASVTDSRTMATALVKVHAFSGLWDPLQEAAAEALKRGTMLANASKTYAGAAASSATPDVLVGLAERHLSHPTDSHPPLSVRLESLGIDLPSVSDAALNVIPADPAVELVSGFEEHEQEISEAYQLLLAKRLDIDLNATGPTAEEAAAKQTG